MIRQGQKVQVGDLVQVNDPLLGGHALLVVTTAPNRYGNFDGIRVDVEQKSYLDVLDDLSYPAPYYDHEVLSVVQKRYFVN